MNKKITRENAIRLAKLILAGCFLIMVSPVSGEERPPNILFILADDLGYGDLGVTGHPYARSPNLDTLASQGVRFTQAYMAAAWCAPSRYSLMSGVFPARQFTRSHLLPVENPTVFSILKAAGYATAHFGKWHMGDERQNAPPPSDYGVDESLSTQSSGPDWPREARQDPHYREKTTPRYVDLTIDFMRENRDRPFYINLWIYPTHSYINPTEEQLAVYDGLETKIEDFQSPLQREFLRFVSEHGDIQKAMQAYCADVTAMDTEIGRLLEAMEQLGLEDNTIVIFSSDNGPGPLCNNWDNIVKRYKERPLLLNNVGSAGPFRDRKISLHEGGIRVPLIVRWPGKIRRGSVDTETIFTGTDYLPTVAALANVPVPDMYLDGVDLSSAFTSAVPVQRSKPIFWSDRPGWVAMRDGKWKAHIQGGTFSLYNLETDPSESNNLAESIPETAAKYEKMLKDWSAAIHN